MSKNIFISRELTPESDFCTTLADVKCKIFDLGLIDFELVHFEVLPECDWIFFYSKAGIDYFFQNMNEKKYYFRQLQNGQPLEKVRQNRCKYMVLRQLLSVQAVL